MIHKVFLSDSYDHMTGVIELTLPVQLAVKKFFTLKKLPLKSHSHSFPRVISPWTLGNCF